MSWKNRLCTKVLTAKYKVGNNWLRVGVAMFGKDQPILFGKERNKNICLFPKRIKLFDFKF